MKIEDSKITKDVMSVLGSHFNIEATDVKFINIGEESQAYTVKNRSGDKYFVKYCDKKEVIEGIEGVNELLNEIKDLNFVVPPLRANNGRTTVTLGTGKVYVFPFIDGRVIEQGNHTFSKDVVEQLTDIVVQIHKRGRSITTVLPVEDFNNNYKQQFTHLDTQFNERADEFKKLFTENRELI